MREFGHHREIRVLTFPALAIRQSKTRLQCQDPVKTELRTGASRSVIRSLVPKATDTDLYSPSFAPVRYSE